MKRFYVHYLFLIALCLVLGMLMVGSGCLDDDDDDDDDDDSSPAGNSDCDLECYSKGMNDRLICEIDYYTCLLACAPTDTACQTICGDDFDTCSATAEYEARDCAEACAGCFLTMNNCLDTAFSDIDTCWQGCGGNQTCQNNCTAQFNTDILACDTAMDNCYSWYNRACQDTVVNAWNTCAQNCDTLTDYNEKWDCYRSCSDAMAIDIQKCFTP